MGLLTPSDYTLYLLATDHTLCLIWSAYLTCPLWDTKELDLRVNNKEGLLSTIQKGTKTAASSRPDSLPPFIVLIRSIIFCLLWSDRHCCIVSDGILREVLVLLDLELSLNAAFRHPV